MKLLSAVLLPIILLCAAPGVSAGMTGFALEEEPPCRGSVACRDAALEALQRDWAQRSHHPLVGRVLPLASEGAAVSPSSSGSERLLDLSAFAQKLRSDLGAQERSAILVAGEIHDNPQHHILRALLLPRYFDGEPHAQPIPFVFEQITADKQPAIDAFLAGLGSGKTKAPLAEFYAAIDWKASGWDKYHFDPLFDAVFEDGLPIYAGDPPRGAVRRLAKEGVSALEAGERAALGLDAPLGPALDTASGDEIAGSHCGMLPKSAIPRMALAQRYRDAHLADVVLKAAQRHGGAVLLTGNVHARTDRGVPWYLRQRAPGRSIVAMLLVEVEDGRTDPSSYAVRGPDGAPAADYVVFTPRTPRGDPCEAFKNKSSTAP